MRTLLLDLEGTIYTRDGVIPGAIQAVDQLRAKSDAVRFLTNTDSRSSADLLASLRQLGLDLAPDELFTPVTAAAELISPRGGSTFFLGTQAVRRQLAERIALTDDPDAATHVVVGDCRQTLTYPLLDAAYAAVASGGRLVALQQGRYFLSCGRQHLDTGAIVAALEFATGVTAELVGKPSPTFLRLALAPLDAAAHGEVWVVGDDPTSDIAMGEAFGAITVQVRTGKYSLEDPVRTVAATHIVDSLVDVPALL